MLKKNVWTVDKLFLVSILLKLFYTSDSIIFCIHPASHHVLNFHFDNKNVFVLMILYFWIFHAFFPLTCLSEPCSVRWSNQARCWRGGDDNVAELSRRIRELLRVWLDIFHRAWPPNRRVLPDLRPRNQPGKTLGAGLVKYSNLYNRLSHREHHQEQKSPQNVLDKIKPVWF